MLNCVKKREFKSRDKNHFQFDFYDNEIESFVGTMLIVDPY